MSSSRPRDLPQENKPIPRPTHSKAGGEIEYYLDGDIEMRKYLETGVIQQWRPDIGKNGRWVFAPGTAKAAMIQTKEQAQAMVNTRWDAVREAAVLGIMDATGKTTEPEALRELQRVYTSHSLAGGRGGASYADKVIELADLRKPRQDASITDPRTGGSISGPPEWVERILAAVRRSKPDSEE